MNRSQIIRSAQKYINKRKPTEFTMSLGLTDDQRIVFAYSVKRESTIDVMMEVIDKHNKRQVPFYDS